MNAALFRWYTKQDGTKVKALQGKVFNLKGKDIFYRDLKEHHGRMFKHAGAWNLDYRTFKFLKKYRVKHIHYYWHFNKKLYTVTTRKIDSWIKRGKIVKEKINGHTQLFLPKEIFTQQKKDYTPPWLRREIDISTNVERVLAEEKATPDGYFNTMRKLGKVFRQRYA